MSKNNMHLEQTVDLTWNPEDPEASLNRIIAYARGLAVDAYTWYATEKARKSVAAKWTRVLAIFLGGAGGIIPIVSVMKTSAGTPLLSPAWATAAVGCAGVLVLFDRFFGLSSGWMRFAGAMLLIRARITAFDMDIAALRAQTACAARQESACAAILDRCKALVSDINGIILDESDRWKQEFNTEISRMDEKIKEKEPEGKEKG